MPELIGFEGWCPVHHEQNCEKVHLWKSREKELKQQYEKVVQEKKKNFFFEEAKWPDPFGGGKLADVMEDEF